MRRKRRPLPKLDRCKDVRQSWRNAMAGSMLTTRLAGTRQARTAIRIKAIGAPFIYPRQPHLVRKQSFSGISAVIRADSVAVA